MSSISNADPSDTSPSTSTSTSTSTSPSSNKPAARVIIVPGNGNAPIRISNWYAWLAGQLTDAGFDVRMSDMPDPIKARETIWLPFIRNKLGLNEDSIIIGHSSGAEAAMRLLETDKIRGVVLVSACWTDLGEPNERISGYYSRPWNWRQMYENAGWIVQLGSVDDPFIPIKEHRYVAGHLNTEYHEFKKRGHFIASRIPEVVDIVVKYSKTPPEKKQWIDPDQDTATKTPTDTTTSTPTTQSNVPSTSTT